VEWCSGVVYDGELKVGLIHIGRERARAHEGIWQAW
jgi:hypothetical protein